MPEQRVDALVPARGELRLGRDDVDRVDAVETREQIEVDRPEPAGVDRPICHADDEPPVGRGTRVLEAEVAETVLVHGAARSTRRS